VFIGDGNPIGAVIPVRGRGPHERGQGQGAGDFPTNGDQNVLAKSVGDSPVAMHSGGVLDLFTYVPL